MVTSIRSSRKYSCISSSMISSVTNSSVPRAILHAKRLSQPPSGRRPMQPLAKRNGCYCKHRYHQKYLFYSPTTLSLIYGISRAKATSTLSLTIRWPILPKRMPRYSLRRRQRTPRYHSSRHWRTMLPTRHSVPPLRVPWWISLLISLLKLLILFVLLLQLFLQL